MAAVHMALVAVGALPLVAGHGSVLFPPTRNAIDSELEPWSSATIAGGKQQFPYTGHWKYMPFGARPVARAGGGRAEAAAGGGGMAKMR